MINGSKGRKSGPLSLSHLHMSEVLESSTDFVQTGKHPRVLFRVNQYGSSGGRQEGLCVTEHCPKRPEVVGDIAARGAPVRPVPSESCKIMARLAMLSRHPVCAGVFAKILRRRWEM